MNNNASCIVGTKVGSTELHDGVDVTVDCSSGDVGHVWKGKLPFHVIETDLAQLPMTRTKLMVNVGDPSQAFAFAQLPAA